MPLVKTKHKKKKTKLSHATIIRRLKYMKKNYIGEIDCLNELIRDLEGK